MRKILLEAKNLSIGDTVASIPYMSKFQEVNPEDKIFVLIREGLVPHFEIIYSNIEYIKEEDNQFFDKIIHLRYNYNKSIQSGYAEQLGFIDPPYIRPKMLVPDMERPIKNKYVSIGIHSTSQL